jgi:hypothetical protein
MLEAITYTSSWDIRIIKVYPVNSVHYTIFKEVWTSLQLLSCPFSTLQVIDKFQHFLYSRLTPNLTFAYFIMS